MFATLSLMIAITITVFLPLIITIPIWYFTGVDLILVIGTLIQIVYGVYIIAGFLKKKEV